MLIVFSFHRGHKSRSTSLQYLQPLQGFSSTIMLKVTSHLNISCRSCWWYLRRCGPRPSKLLLPEKLSHLELLGGLFKLTIAGTCNFLSPPLYGCGTSLKARYLKIGSDETKTTWAEGLRYLHVIWVKKKPQLSHQIDIKPFVPSKGQQHNGLVYNNWNVLPEIETP